MPAPPTSPRTVLITGAAGGVGQALVAEFLREGWRVAAAFHSATPHIESGSLWPVRLDVTNREQAQAVVKQLLARWGRIDGLINNAGLTSDRLSWQIDEADWDRVLDVNLKGAFLCSQCAIKPMISQRDGHIINIASFAARSGQRGQASYAAAKAGLIGLTGSLAKEVGSRNVRVNAILPGVVPTPMTARLTEARLNELAAVNALGRLNSVAEVARFAAFLATTQNISGQLFQLDSRIAPWA